MIFAPTTGLENRATFSGAVNPSRTTGGGGSFSLPASKKARIIPASERLMP